MKTGLVDFRNGGQVPSVRLALLLLRQAVEEKADELILSLKSVSVEDDDDGELESMAAEFARRTESAARQPQAFVPTLIKAGQTNPLSAVPDHLFGPVVRVFLGLVEINYFAKGLAEGRIETKNPPSVWKLMSRDLACELRLARIWPARLPAAGPA